VNAKLYSFTMSSIITDEL